MARNFTIIDWKIWNWPITDWRIHHLARVCGFSGFGLRSASGESGAEGGEERLAHRSRSATPRRRAADGSPPLMAAHCGCPLMTSARFAEWRGRRREGDRDDGQPVERSKPRVGHGGFTITLVSKCDQLVCVLRNFHPMCSCAKRLPDSKIMRAGSAKCANHWNSESDAGSAASNGTSRPQPIFNRFE
jgi:hypothetical protein